ncbi:hypothetical protein [Treponema sp. R80B11-R83G3]
MYNLDTGEEVDLDLFLNALENEEIIIDGRSLTEQDKEEIDKKIAMHKEMQKTRVKEPVLALS